MNQELEALAAELAGMKCRGCTGCRGSGGIRALTPEAFDLCHGTGYLFTDTVRVPCKCTRYKRPHPGFAWTLGFGYSPCLRCGDGLSGGRGWTPSLDFVTWCWALHEAGYDVEVSYPAGSQIAPEILVHDLFKHPRTGTHFAEAEALLKALAQKEQHAD